MADTTAYEQSQQAGRTLMQSLAQAEQSVATEQQKTAMHKYAFRTAFDFLAEMWPPVLSADYFTVAAAKCNERFNQSGQDKLTHELLLGVFNYLETVVVEENGKAS